MFSNIIYVIICVILFGCGIFFIYSTFSKNQTIRFVIGIIFFIGGLCLLGLPTSNYTDWKASPKVELILPIDGEYVIDNGDEYVYKVLKYSELGEEKERYYTIKKDENTVVIIQEIGADGVANVSNYTREAKSLVGVELASTLQTKYVFYIPK